jgi:Cu2+-exporting ATPase
MLKLAGSLAQSSHHPLARAVRDHAQMKFGVLDLVTDVEEVSGQGVRAVINGAEIRLGSPDFCNAPRSVWHDASSVIAFRAGETSGLIAVGQSLRPDAKAVIEALKARGFDVAILSGDHKAAVQSVAEYLEIKTWLADVKPAEKLAKLETLRREGKRVLMVGDGLNDAPALAAAHVSLSPATGADVTQAAADAVFTGAKLAAVSDALALCRKGRRVMIENFDISLIYNLIAVPLAVLGYVTPLIAAAAMSGSSVIVTVNALRARRAKEVVS